MDELFGTASPYVADVPPDRVRSDLRVQVAYGDLTVWQVITLALDGGTYHPARQILLRKLLGDQEEETPGGNAKFLRLIGELLEEKRVDRKTVGWLVDDRCGGRRLAAWREAELSPTVHAGFPWLPM